MPIRSTILLVFLLAAPAPAAPDDPCAAASSVSDVRFVLALKDGRARFQEGEIIPLVLSFTSTAKKRYWADVRTYDRSGRLGIERYCVEPEAPDPLESYFTNRGFILGGLGGIQELGSVPFNAPDKLARLAALTSTERQRREIDRWIGYWNEPTALIRTFWSAHRDPAFSLLQYDGLTEARLRTKLAQLPRGKRLAWQFWPQHPAMVSMAVQEACYARMRAVAEKHGLTLDRAGNPINGK